MADESPLLIKYKKQYDKNPRSTIFAPLAELYRKLGLLDQAFEILREGIRHNPSYLMGYLTLASCYFDQGQFPMAYATLRPLVDSNNDNLRLLKLFARVCFELGHNEESLTSYKYLLFLNPRDNEVALKVCELEDREQPIIQETVDSSYFNESNLNTSPFEDLEQWTQVDFGGRSPAVVGNGWESQEIDQVEFDENREILELESSVNDAITLVPDEPAEISNEDDQVDDIKEIEALSITEPNAQPIVTHTLVDLYCAQGYYSKAKEILAKILELNPEDQRSIDRMIEIDKSILNCASSGEVGDNAILAALDLRLADEESDLNNVKEQKLLNFLDAIKRRSAGKRDFLK